MLIDIQEKVTISSWHLLMTNMMRTVSWMAALFIVIIMSSTFFSSCQAGNCKQHHYFYLIQIFISSILGSINLTKNFFYLVFFKSAGLQPGGPSCSSPLTRPAPQLKWKCQPYKGNYAQAHVCRTKICRDERAYCRIRGRNSYGRTFWECCCPVD
jgi:hypothetical protein